jgi:hypothetical protein
MILVACLTVVAFAWSAVETLLALRPARVTRLGYLRFALSLAIAPFLLTIWVMPWETIPVEWSWIVTLSVALLASGTSAGVTLFLRRARSVWGVLDRATGHRPENDP